MSPEYTTRILDLGIGFEGKYIDQGQPDRSSGGDNGRGPGRYSESK